MHQDTRFNATQEIQALITRAINGLAPIASPQSVNSSGVFINPRMKLAALRAAREHIDQAVAAIERKWPA